MLNWYRHFCPLIDVSGERWMIIFCIHAFFLFGCMINIMLSPSDFYLDCFMFSHVTGMMVLLLQKSSKRENRFDNENVLTIIEEEAF